MDLSFELVRLRPVTNALSDCCEWVLRGGLDLPTLLDYFVIDFWLVEPTRPREGVTLEFEA